MPSIEEQFPYNTATESVVERDWAAGTKEQGEHADWIVRDVQGVLSGEYTNVVYSPAWLKIIDEPIVNACDHLVRCLNGTNPVRNIGVDFDPTGLITVYNDGPGLPVAVHKVATEKLKRTTYVPSFVFGELFQGSNKQREPDSIIGGANGLGAKLSNCFSTRFEVETVCSGMYFRQTWHDHNSRFDEPCIGSAQQLATNLRKDHTCLRFMPDYTGLFGYKEFGAAQHAKLVDLVRARVAFAAAYCHYTVGKKYTFCMRFNNQPLCIKSATDLCKILLPGARYYSATITPDAVVEHHTYPWEVCVVTKPAHAPGYCSNVNGIVVNQGRHAVHLVEQLCEHARCDMAKLFKDKNVEFRPAYVTDHVFVFINSKIPNPTWTGQRKDQMSTVKTKFIGYKLPRKLLNDVVADLQNTIRTAISASRDKPIKQKDSNIDMGKYTPARYSGTKRSAECHLIAVEGDSAMTNVRKGLKSNRALGFDLYGIICLGGVIVNARRECTVIDIDGETHVEKSTKLAKNKFMNTFCEVTGLNTQHKYQPGTPTYKQEMKALKYGGIIACVDQDLDGKGCILGLILNCMQLLWPNLLRAGFVKWFRTPIIRAWPKNGGQVLSFYSVEDHKKWSIDHAGYLSKYYKGLSSHGDDEVTSMFREFQQNLFVYDSDAECENTFELYFGGNPELRKRELSKPDYELSSECLREQENTKRINCSDHLNSETRLFQKDNLERKLDSAVDGQNQAGRKIVDGLMKTMAAGREIKVETLGGFVSINENYHHGQASLDDSITGKGFLTVGGKQLPFIVPCSNFGSRYKGGKDAGQPRYIFAKLNHRLTRLLFQEADYYLLPFNFDEGQRGEPTYFVPIIPLAITEFSSLPAHGWKLETWARDVFAVIENVQRMITNEHMLLTHMPVATGKGGIMEWKGTIVQFCGKNYSFGKYVYVESTNTVYITELPLRVWTSTYVTNLQKKMYKSDSLIESIHDASGDHTVYIEIKLKPHATSVLSSLGDTVFSDGFEEYFMLKERMVDHINLYGKNREVLEFGSYVDVLKYWFPIRKEYYAKRVARQLLLFSFEIALLENTIRYIKDPVSKTLTRMKLADMHTVLTGAGYTRINRARANNPEFIPVHELEQAVYETDATYDYLLDLTDRKKSAESLEEFEKRLHAVRVKRDEYSALASAGSFSGSQIWLQELEELKNVVAEGFATNWMFGDKTKYKL